MLPTPRKRQRSSSVPKKAGSKDDQDLKRMVKKVVLGLSETKSPINSVNFTLSVTDTLYAVNLNYFISEGVTAYQVVGEKCMLKNIHLRGAIVQNGSATLAATYNSPKSFRILIIKTKDALTTSTAAITLSSVMRQESGTSSTGVVTGCHVDLHKVKLLHDQVYNFPAKDMITSAPVPSSTRPYDINIPLNRTEFFDGDGSGVFQTGNYYAIFAYEDLINFVPSGFSTRLQWSVNIKDA